MPVDRARGVYEKNGVNNGVIMFTAGVMVIKMSKMAHFLYFLMAANNQSVGASIVSAFERSCLALSENAMDCWVLNYH